VLLLAGVITVPRLGSLSSEISIAMLTHIIFHIFMAQVMVVGMANMGITAKPSINRQ
jgi:hypothetical protein